MTAITLDLHSIVKLTDEQFYQLCLDNPDVKFERTASGELIVMPPTGWGTGKKNTIGCLDRPATGRYVLHICMCDVQDEVSGAWHLAGVILGMLGLTVDAEAVRTTSPEALITHPRASTI